MKTLPVLALFVMSLLAGAQDTANPNSTATG